MKRKRQIMVDRIPLGGIMKTLDKLVELQNMLKL